LILKYYVSILYNYINISILSFTFILISLYYNLILFYNINIEILISLSYILILFYNINIKILS
jgi:hypothetical protein